MSDDDFLDRLNDEQRAVWRQFTFLGHTTDYVRLVIAQEQAAVAAQCVQAILDREADRVAVLRRCGGEPMPDHFRRQVAQAFLHSEHGRQARYALPSRIDEVFQEWVKAGGPGLDRGEEQDFVRGLPAEET